MVEGISVPSQGVWSLIRGEAAHWPAHWADRAPLPPREIGAISSEDRDERADAIRACDLHLADLIREHGVGYTEAPPQKRKRGRPRQAA